MAQAPLTEVAVKPGILAVANILVTAPHILLLVHQHRHTAPSILTPVQHMVLMVQPLTPTVQVIQALAVRMAVVGTRAIHIAHNTLIAAAHMALMVRVVPLIAPRIVVAVIRMELMVIQIHIVRHIQALVVAIVRHGSLACLFEGLMSNILGTLYKRQPEIIKLDGVFYSFNELLLNEDTDQLLRRSNGFPSNKCWYI